MPVWNSHTREYVDQGRLTVIGIAQELHDARCQLFAQWHALDWPILYDPLNTMQVTGVPIEVAIDEYGIVRHLRVRRETLATDFLDKTYAAEGVEGASSTPGQAVKPDLQALQDKAVQQDTGHAWRNLGDALLLWQGTSGIDDAIAAYTQALRRQPQDGDAHFRLGTCYRLRYESSQGRPTDFQKAVDHWTRARALRPDQYIWRRRIEQYGPRLTKPYPFYDWVTTASAAIRARGEHPVALKTLPTGSEIAAPAQDFMAESQATPPQALERIQADKQSLVLFEITVVPPQVKPGQTVRVHMTLRPNDALQVHWNNESEPLTLWVDLPEAWQAQPRLLLAPVPEKPETSEPRRFEFELQVPAHAQGTDKPVVHAWYYVCEDRGGTCQFLHQAVPVAVGIVE